MPFCRSCDAVVFWAKTEAGKSIPLDHAPTVSGNVVLSPVGGGARLARVIAGEELQAWRSEGKTLYISHFATCPSAADWKSKPKAR